MNQASSPQIAGKMPINEILFHQGDEFFDQLLEDCSNASKSIYIEAYIFQTDQLGKKLLQVLAKKAQQGVKVKILIDGIGSLSFCPFLLKKYLNQCNLEICFYNPLPFQILTANKKSFWKLPILIAQSIFHLNKRNHRKIYVIDELIAFVGSINITSEHSLRLFGERSWRDTGLKIEDQRVQFLTQTFLNTFHKVKTLTFFKNYDSKKDLICDGLLLNQNRNLRNYNFQQLLYFIENAKRRIWITNPYFVPDEKIITSLKRAANNGVDIKIIIPQKSDMSLFPLINSMSSRRLVDQKIKIYEYRPRILHAKIMIIDNWCRIGSSNLNQRSFKHDLEVDLVLLDEKNIKKAGHQFLDDLSHSDELKKGDILKRYGKSLITLTFIRLIRYWL